MKSAPQRLDNKAGHPLTDQGEHHHDPRNSQPSHLPPATRTGGRTSAPPPLPAAAPGTVPSLRLLLPRPLRTLRHGNLPMPLPRHTSGPGEPMTTTLGTGEGSRTREIATSDALKRRFQLRIQAHCQSLSSDIGLKRPDQIRNRLSCLVANVDALLDQLENN